MTKYIINADDFASADNLAKYTPDGIVEIMVHPYYNSKGELIDRVELEDGFPVGPHSKHLLHLTKN
ncbi:MAG: hypothetical protein U0M06_06755 [Clostridia bacterium]|nr:hypothetical protein [Clostridia bacterium]